MAKVTELRPLQRRLNLADIAVLVFATAIGLATIRRDLTGLFAIPKALENGRWVDR